jgi:hypothetical protein
MTRSSLSMNWRVIRSVSSGVKSLAGQLMPPLAPPYGIPTIAVFQLMSAASARTSSRSTSGWYRMPPLYGPRAPLCCTR